MISLTIFPYLLYHESLNSLPSISTKGDSVEQVVIHLRGTAEEVRNALTVLAGQPVVKVSPEASSPEVITPPVDNVSLTGNKRPILRKGPYSDTICARSGCFNKLTMKQVKQGSKYCSMSCAGKARRGRVGGGADNLHATIVAGEGVVKGSVLSEENGSRLPVPS